MPPTVQQLQRWLQEWEDGRTKNDIERVELNDPCSHGKAITQMWRLQLGIETEAVHPMRAEINRLRQLVIDLGGDPDA
jgi:Tfp pilus assembly PilM family ATPase